ncbi:hypothetical protein DCAR_0313163 [Daucus carota subsp. sativus]|uniref:Fungal lipase-like domain-containing protein n=1 Tax=Daucus carota subsp. sativus TaxID=79200 RepID=A0AAF0WPW2_DAUCS|nr:PREDICTED: uncharacterized protein LOC108211039 isoform X3 [Daucus carota subsp. sativus]WOG93875.1 hypothetical protein DCAR_0313163 [Daucus carota subsp. sativus]
MPIFCCGVECVVAFGFLRWAWKRCTYIGAYDSATWPEATAAEFSPVPRLCRIILAIYEEDLGSPRYRPADWYGMNLEWVIKRVTYQQTMGRSPPYLIYIDHINREIVLAIRGLNLVNQDDYKLLLDNRLGMQKFDGGYVHHGLLKSAIWLLRRESETLKNLWVENGSCYKMVFTGHSLGSGVAALLTVIAVNHGACLGGVPRSKISCYAMAPARCMSLNLAVKYADVINSVVLQDDFLPRTATPLEDIFKSVFCLPCLLFLLCLRDTFIPERRKLGDPRRLYAPGRMYHIVDRKFCRCGRYPPEVRTAIPVEERFEHIVLSCSTTSDHAIFWIEREAETALEILKENNSGTLTTAPEVQRIERLYSLEKEHKDALERAVSLDIPHVVSDPQKKTLKEEEEEEEKEEGFSSGDKEGGFQNESKDAQRPSSSSVGERIDWNDVVHMLFDKNECGKLQLKRDVAAASK